MTRHGLGLVDSAVYVEGDRVASPTSLAETYESLHERQDGLAWIGLYRPDEAEVSSLASEFGLHELAVEDAIVAHQRPKLEHSPAQRGARPLQRPAANGEQPGPVAARA